MSSTTGAQLLVRLLEQQGIRQAAGIPGGAILPVYDALCRSGSIRHILARHEQGAGFIAQGMARSTGRPGVCFTSSGPGATNLVTALADARRDSVPLVAITGQVPSEAIGTDAFQEVDVFGLSLPVTKHSFLVRSAEELHEVVPAAFRIAASGRPGPVLVDIPKDVQQAAVAERAPAAAAQGAAPDGPPAPEPAELDRAAKLINAAERPVLYLGGGIIASGAADQARQLAEKAGLPTTMTLHALGAIPADHPRSIGMLGMHGARYTNMVLEECDLLIACGARFDDRATGKVAEFCPEASVIHMDIDDSEFHKVKPAHVALHGDVAGVLDGLLPRVAPRPRGAWQARVAELAAQYPLALCGAEDPAAPYGLVRAVAEAAGDEAIVATDVGQHQMWVAQAYPFRAPRRWLTSGGLGTMGFGLPAALGAALAHPEQPVVCFTGDGSLLMNLQELAPVAEEGLNLKIVLMDNAGLGLVHQQQAMFYQGGSYQARYPQSPDFRAIARGFGLAAHDLGVGDPVQTLEAAFATDGPCLIHAPVDPEERVYPMVPPGAANRDMIGD